VKKLEDNLDIVMVTLFWPSKTECSSLGALKSVGMEGGVLGSLE
jgi:hypothetical protein